MPIVRVPYPTALPTEQNDYVKQNNLLEIGFMRHNEPWPVSGANIVQGATFQIGGTVYYADADTAIGGAASDYVKLTPSGDGSTCAADFVASLAGVTWNKAYNGYYDVLGCLYVFNEGKAMIAGKIAAVVGRYVMQTRDGDVYAGRDLVGGRDVDIRGTADGDRNIKFASDASISWDESEDAIVFNKRMKPVLETWNDNTNQNQDEWFDKFSPHIPNVGDVILVSGVGYGGGGFGFSTQAALSSIKRKDANTITIYGIVPTTATLIAYDCVNGSATWVSAVISIAW